MASVRRLEETALVVAETLLPNALETISRPTFKVVKVATSAETTAKEAIINKIEK